MIATKNFAWKKEVWLVILMQRRNFAELCNSLPSIHKMSIQEIHSKWAVQYKYHNFVTNYKRLQKKIKTKLSQPAIDGKSHNFMTYYKRLQKKIKTKLSQSSIDCIIKTTLLWILQYPTKSLQSNKMSQKSLCMAQLSQRNHLDWTKNIALLLFFMSFTWCLIQKFITWT